MRLVRGHSPRTWLGAVIGGCSRGWPRAGGIRFSRRVAAAWVGRFAWRSHLVVIFAFLMAMMPTKDEDTRIPFAIFVLLLIPAYHLSPFVP